MWNVLVSKTEEGQESICKIYSSRNDQPAGPLVQVRGLLAKMPTNSSRRYSSLQCAFLLHTHTHTLQKSEFRNEVSWEHRHSVCLSQWKGPWNIEERKIPGYQIPATWHMLALISQVTFKELENPLWHNSHWGQRSILRITQNIDFIL